MIIYENDQNHGKIMQTLDNLKRKHKENKKKKHKVSTIVSGSSLVLQY